MVGRGLSSPWPTGVEWTHGGEVPQRPRGREAASNGNTAWQVPYRCTPASQAHHAGLCSVEGGAAVSVDTEGVCFKIKLQFYMNLKSSFDND